jgi:chromosome segregation ATPase
VRDNRKFATEKEGLNQRMSSLRTVNKQLEKKAQVNDASSGKSIKKELVDANDRVKELEEWATELEDKLSFTVDKFEEQNQRFMECGKELAESQDRCAQLENVMRSAGLVATPATQYIVQDL